MDTKKIESYLQTFLDDVISPKINDELVGKNDEPITLKVYKVFSSFISLFTSL